MSVVKVAILGFGTVGEGVYKTIHSHAEELTAVLGKKVEVAAVLIKNKQKRRNIADEVLITSDIEEILQLPQLDLVVEAIVGKEQPFSFLQKAIKRGCHIITANKEMFASHSSELLKLAEENHVSVGFEATVGGGIPIIQTLRQLLKINRVQHVQGIVNGTSNFILTEMREKQQSFAAALKLAQENGFAEADPTNDVEGFDAFYKLMILSRIAFGQEPNWNEVDIAGITSITSELIETAEKLGLRFKHIVSAGKVGSQVKGSVSPVLVSKNHPFYHVEGVENAINVHSDIVGRITLQGPGAGMFPTASAVIEDLVYVCQSHLSRGNHSQTSQAASASVQDKKESSEFWLVHGLQGNYLNPLISWIEQIGEETFIIRAAKEDVVQLATQNKTVLFYLIVDGYQLTNLNKQESLTVSL
ncbi:homoserine dehydrogenase [Neobacillus ginsengisoli]|uniref:Homoserine dehydrogenase n=1 Tax=Neobacillus ginsengisoli TaxID=904295 RepID=A0ABT9XYN6_9BACI|nr:homoserine dehydrogenase [Neobacillus ginsengisoli]MDQ0200678.1 homoserine dehydrogenase [Neobacillus ginsengisoli]